MNKCKCTLTRQVLERGPVAIAILAHYDLFHYQTGVYHHLPPHLLPVSSLFLFFSSIFAFYNILRVVFCVHETLQPTPLTSHLTTYTETRKARACQQGMQRASSLVGCGVGNTPTTR